MLNGSSERTCSVAGARPGGSHQELVLLTGRLALLFVSTMGLVAPSAALEVKKEL